MRYENNYYLTSDGSLDIEFLFVEIAQSEWRIYILSNINYGSRSTNASDIHRLTENDETRKNLIRSYLTVTRTGVDPNCIINYICWSSTITSLEMAREIAQT